MSRMSSFRPATTTLVLLFACVACPAQAPRSPDPIGGEGGDPAGSRPDSRRADAVTSGRTPDGPSSSTLDAGSTPTGMRDAGSSTQDAAGQGAPDADGAHVPAAQDASLVSERFVSWVWSGAVTPTSARVNAKLGRDSASVRLLVSAFPDLRSAQAFGPVAARADGFRVVTVSATGLRPGTSYHYALEADGRVDLERAGRFKTPAEGAFSYTFAAGACAETGSNHPVFAAVARHDPLFFLHVVQGRDRPGPRPPRDGGLGQHGHLAGHGRRQQRSLVVLRDRAARDRQLDQAGRNGWARFASINGDAHMLAMRWSGRAADGTEKLSHTFTVSAAAP